MQKNVFKDAYFGKPYRTRNDRKALYLGKIKEDTKPLKHILNIEKFGSVKDTNYFLSDGTAFGIDGMFDIVSEWEVPINDEELMDLSCACYPCDNETDARSFHKGFKAGYREAIR